MASSERSESANHEVCLKTIFINGRAARKIAVFNI